MADFDRIGSQTPLLSNLKPHGKVNLLYVLLEYFKRIYPNRNLDIYFL